MNDEPPPHSSLRDPPSLILLVEKDLASRMRSAHELLDDGYEVVESENASEAMHILDGRDDFDAMITDVDPDQAPGGLSLVRYAASRHRAMKILVGSDWIEAQVEASGVAANFLPKHPSAGALVRQMQNLLAEAPAFPLAAIV